MSKFDDPIEPSDDALTDDYYWSDEDDTDTEIKISGILITELPNVKKLVIGPTLVKNKCELKITCEFPTELESLRIFGYTSVEIPKFKGCKNLCLDVTAFNDIRKHSLTTSVVCKSLQVDGDMNNIDEFGFIKFDNLTLNSIRGKVYFPTDFNKLTLTCSNITVDNDFKVKTLLLINDNSMIYTAINKIPDGVEKLKIIACSHIDFIYENIHKFKNLKKLIINGITRYDYYKNYDFSKIHKLEYFETDSLMKVLPKCQKAKLSGIDDIIEQDIECDELLVYVEPWRYGSLVPPVKIEHLSKFAKKIKIETFASYTLPESYFGCVEFIRKKPVNMN